MLKVTSVKVHWLKKKSGGKKGNEVSSFCEKSKKGRFNRKVGMSFYVVFLETLFYFFGSLGVSNPRPHAQWKREGKESSLNVSRPPTHAEWWPLTSGMLEKEIDAAAITLSTIILTMTPELVNPSE